MDLWSGGLLHLFDGLLAKEDHQLPLAGHVVTIFDDVILNRRMEVMQFMWAQEVIVSDPQGKVIAGPIIAVEAVRRAVRGLVGPVKPLDHLLIRAEFFRDCIFVRQTDDLRDIKLKVFSELMEELLGGKRIGTVTVGDKTEAVGKLFQVLEGHAHSHDAGTDAAVVRDLIADHGAGGDRQQRQTLFRRDRYQQRA